MAYNYDARGNRTAQGVMASYAINDLDQISGRNLNSRSFGLIGSVNPDATVTVFHPLNLPAGETLTPTATGAFAGWWPLPANYNGGLGGRLDLKVRGTLPPQVPGGTAATADVDLFLPLAPSEEALSYDGPGRLKEDAFFDYQWDHAGRLKQTTRKTNMLLEPAQTAEITTYQYDADNRRIKKSWQRTYSSGRVRVVNSQVLWSGTLPVMEEYTDSEGPSGRRWFQWGRDLSGSLEGSGGIGGLVAIIDERAGGAPRILLPVNDGLGNITAVVDQTSGQVVARYEYGPFGEPLGESGEAEVCPFRWQTKWYDQESQHYYFLHRYYDPRLGRWLSRDPLGESGGLNLYAYCGNDPVNKHDPLGLSVWDTPLINGGTYPVGDPFYDQANGQWMVTMRKVVALTLGGRMNTATDSVMTLGAAKRLAPHPSYWTKPLPSQPTLLAGTGFQGPSFGQISNYIENHPGWQMELGIMESVPFALGGGYVFGGVRALIGTRAASYLGSGLLGMGLGEWASNDFAVNPRTAGQVIGGLPAGGLSSNAFRPQRFTLGNNLVEAVVGAGDDVIVRDSAIALARTRGAILGMVDDLPLIASPNDVLTVVGHGSHGTLNGLGAAELAGLLAPTVQSANIARLELISCFSAEMASEVAFRLQIPVRGAHGRVNILDGLFGIPQVRRGYELLPPGEGFEWFFPSGAGL